LEVLEGAELHMLGQALQLVQLALQIQEAVGAAEGATGQGLAALAAPAWC